MPYCFKKKIEQVSNEVMNYCGNLKKMYNSCAGLGNQSCDVVLVKGAFSLEEPQRVGISEWETDGEQWGGMEMRRSVYEQPGTRVD